MGIANDERLTTIDKLAMRTILRMEDKYIPTTKWCPCCHKLHDMPTDIRTYVCDCGYQEDRDIHSAKNMITIKNLVFSKLNLVPTEHREVKREEFCFAER